MQWVIDFVERESILICRIIRIRSPHSSSDCTNVVECGAGRLLPPSLTGWFTSIGSAPQRFGLAIVAQRYGFCRQ